MSKLIVIELKMGQLLVSDGRVWKDACPSIPGGLCSLSLLCEVLPTLCSAQYN